jgi:hypothetical protein
MNPLNPVNPVDVYFQLMTASGEGIQQSLAQTYLLLRMEALAVAALLVALAVALYALSRMVSQEQRWQRSWERLVRDHRSSWPDWRHSLSATQKAHTRAPGYGEIYR